MKRYHSKGIYKRLSLLGCLGIAILSGGCGADDQAGSSPESGVDFGWDAGAMCTGIQVSRDVASPTTAGNAVTFTATSTCAQGETAQYRFLLRKIDSSVVYNEVQAYSENGSWVWDTTNYARGIYYLMVQVRATGSSSSGEAWRTAQHVIASAAGANCGGEATLGTATTSTPGVLKVTGTSTCTLGAEANYWFAMKPEGTSTFSEIRAWGRANTFNWDTNGLTPGYYVLLMYVRDETSTASAEVFKTIQVLATGGVECSDVQLDRVTPTPQFKGTTVQLDADTTCYGTTVPEVQYYLKLEGQTGYTMLRNWGPTAFEWNTSAVPPGLHIVMVVVRGQGNSAAWEDWQTGYFEILDPTPRIGVNAISFSTSVDGVVMYAADTQSIVTPVGGFNGGGTGNKGYVGIATYDNLSMSALTSLSVVVRRDIGTANFYINMQVDCNGDDVFNPAVDGIVVADSSTYAAFNLPLGTFSTVPLDPSAPIWKMVGGPKASCGNLPSHLASVGLPLSSLPATAKLWNGSTGDGGMPKNKVMPALMFIMNDSSTKIERQVTIDSITVNGTVYSF